MNALYFLPAYESEKIEKIKTKLQEIVRVQTVDLENEFKSYPENFITDFPKLIFVPTIYNNKNAFSYQGVELAIRWYLHVIREKKDLNFKIILLGAEEKATFFQNCDFSSFLKCPNVEYLQNNLETVSKYLKVNQEKEINLNEALTT